MECFDHSPSLWDEWLVFFYRRPTSLTTAIRHARTPAALSGSANESRRPCTRTSQSRMRIHRFASAGKYRSGSARRNRTIVGSSFCPRDRQSLGIPPHNYIVQRRVEHAQKLLRNTDLPVSEIAIVAGFTDQSHLARHFRTITGVSPSLARHRFRTGPDILPHRSAQVGS
jgi:AraC-like DNA-binding protein